MYKTWLPLALVLLVFLLLWSDAPRTSGNPVPAASSLSQDLPLEPALPDSLDLLLTKTRLGPGGGEDRTLYSQSAAGGPAPPRFWEAAPKSPSVSLVEIDGEEILSVSPGPEDEVNVIVQLREDPVAVFMAQPRETRLSYELEAQAIHDYREEILETHSGVVAAMRQEDLSFVPTQYYSFIFNGIAGSVKMGDLPALAQLPQVERVHRDYQVQITLEESVPLIGAPQVWALLDSQDRTVTGQGVTVAIIDTGIDYTHPDLGGCLGASCKVIGGYDFANDDADPIDDNGHGTHVAGTVGADGVVKGVAPDVKLLAYKVLNQFGSGSFSDVIAGIERATDPDENPATDDAADVINLSLGGPGDPDDPVSQAVDAAADLGVVVAVAAGNSGSNYETLISPGVARKALTVGASTKTDGIASFSSRGPVSSEWAIKPDIVAPGVDIVSTASASGSLSDPSGYISLQGTSMATPHIAGVSALMKQLHPTWTPERIKASLMNTSLDLGYDVFTQGAGRVQAYEAAQTRAVISPGSLSLGLDDTSLSVWEASDSVTITNVSDSTLTYDLTLDHSLPAGVTIDLDGEGATTSVTLAPGESQEVLFTLSVDNDVVPHAPDAPFSYEGDLLAQSGDETLTVPFAFFKGALIHMTFDEEPWVVWLHNRIETVSFVAYPGTERNFLVPEGTFDAIITYPDVATRVFKEGIVVDTVANVAVSKADAIHDVSISPLDIEGDPISVSFGGELVVHKDSELGAWFIFGFPTERKFSDISSAYSWEWAVTTGLKSKEPVHDFNGFANDGVSTDLLFQNQPSDLKHMEFNYTVPPGTGNLMIQHWLSEGPSGGLSFAGFYTQLANSLADPFLRDEYFMPIPYPDFSFGYFFEEVYSFDSDTDEILWDSQLARTSYLAARDNTTVDGFLLGETEAPVLTTDSSRMPVVLPPPHWSGAFDNTDSAIRVRAARGYMAWLFLNQMQDLAPHVAPSYELYQNDVLLESGTLESLDISVDPGAYTLKVFYENYYVNGQQGLATASATFDTQQADKDPPVLLALQVTSSGEPTNTMPPTASGQVDITFSEVLAVSPGLSYSTDDGVTWNSVTVADLGSGEYSAALPNLPNGGIVSLRVQGEDAGGNSLDYMVVPAFAVALGTPQLLSPANGFATYPRDITFQWEAVESAVEYDIQIDDVATFDSPAFVEATVAENQYTASLSRGVRYWRVRARDAEPNESPWSPTWRLTIVDPVVQVSTGTAYDYYPTLIEAADGRLWTVWSRGELWASTSEDGGLTWSAPFSITSGDCCYYGPDMAQTADGTLWVVSYSWTGNSDIRFVTSDDNGATWSAPAQLTTDTGYDSFPSITQTADERIWVVWYSDRSGNYDLWYKTSDDGGATWSSDTQLTTDTATDVFPAITETADGKVWVVWSRGWSNIWYKTSNDGGSTWSSDTQLTSVSYNDRYPSITQTGDGRIWVSWTTIYGPSGTDNWDIWYKSSDDGGATWSTDTLFTRFAGDDWDADITALSSGEPALAWYSDRAASYDIWFGIIGTLEDVNPPPAVQSVTHQPYPNPDSNDLVTVTARIRDETEVASASLVWSMDDTPQPDEAMFDDGAHGDGNAGDDLYGVQIGPFPAGTLVEYQVEATDADGNVVLSPQTPSSFQVLEPFVAASSILLVVDSTWSGDVDFVAPFYQTALESIGQTYDFWDASLRGLVDLDTLDQYLDGVVVWGMPYYGFLTYTQAQANLEAYLDAGGSLFISGQEVGYYLRRRDFYSSYLHATYVQDDVDLYALDGVSGDPISDGLRLEISGGDGANNQYYSDEIGPIAPAVAIWAYDPAATTPLGGVSAGEAGSQAVAGSGTGALRVDTGDYRVVYLAFGFEAINDSAKRSTVMDRALLWLSPSADLSLIQSDSPDPLNALRPLTYTATVTNNGPSEATGVTLTDVLPASARFSSASPSQGSCSEGEGVLTCDLGALTSGASATLTIVVAPQEEGSIENSIEVTSNEPDSNMANNMAIVSTTVNPAPVPVPGVTQWGIIAMSGMFALLLLLALRRQRSRRGHRGGA